MINSKKIFFCAAVFACLNCAVSVNAMEVSAVDEFEKLIASVKSTPGGCNLYTEAGKEKLVLKAKKFPEFFNSLLAHSESYGDPITKFFVIQVAVLINDARLLMKKKDSGDLARFLPTIVELPYTEQYSELEKWLVERQLLVAI